VTALMLDADIQLRLDRLTLDAELCVAAGEVVALLGPNGSGKSTVLRALAGLLPLAGGRVSLGEVLLEDPGRRVRIAPEKRPIALMFQDYLLFPHMSAIDNVAFGLRAHGMDKTAARARASAALGRLGLDKVSEARPGNMSGGQQQRVALARALVTEPRLLLLDEPLAALDVSTKTDVRRHLRKVLRGSEAANILVTHDMLDAVALADRMVVLENGGIVQSGTPAEVTAHPRSPYVADLVGVNLLRGTGTKGRIRLDDGGELAVSSAVSGPVFAVIQPASVTVRRQPEVAGQSGVNTWAGDIAAVDLLGDRVRVRVSGSPPITAEVPPRTVEELKLDEGGQVWTAVDAADVTVYRS
jgi:molybdate transport system ATP-binding protein